MKNIQLSPDHEKLLRHFLHEIIRSQQRQRDMEEYRQQVVTAVLASSGVTDFDGWVLDDDGRTLRNTKEKNDAPLN